MSSHRMNRFVRSAFDKLNQHFIDTVDEGEVTTEKDVVVVIFIWTLFYLLDYGYSVNKLKEAVRKILSELDKHIKVLRRIPKEMDIEV